MNKEIQNVFREIHESGKWGTEETVSGIGSTMAVAGKIVKPITQVITRLGIESVVDIGCGDCNWQGGINWLELGCRYLGTDIVSELIAKNRNKYNMEEHNMKFMVSDATDTKVRTVDMIIWRDVAIHLSNEQVCKTLDSFKRSGCKYLLATTFPLTTANRDIVAGEWRILNLENEPFNMGVPIDTIREYSIDGFHLDKSLCLWEL